MDQDATWYVGRPELRRHCIRWRPSSPTERGTAASTLFGRCLFCPHDIFCRYNSPFCSCNTIAADWPWALTVDSVHSWLVTWSTSWANWKFLGISIVELLFMTTSIRYRWQHV